VPVFFVFVAGCLAAFSGIFGGTCGAPGVIAPGRGELEWFPVSNPALCRVVGMREDGRSMRLFRGPRRTYSLPLGSPNWGFTAHVGGRAPSRVHTWVSPIFSFYGCFSALRLHVSHVRPGLNCIVLSSQLCCLRVVCINMNVKLAAQPIPFPTALTFGKGMAALGVAGDDSARCTECQSVRWRRCSLCDV
jgi:hypothetical protein